MIFFIFVRVYYLGVSGYYYLNGSLALRSFIHVDVGEPTSYAGSMTGMRQDHHLLALQDFGTFMVVLWFWLCCFGFVLEDTWLFTLTHSPTCRNSQSKTTRFDDRLSLERARHELKKKINKISIRSSCLLLRTKLLRLLLPSFLLFKTSFTFLWICPRAGLSTATTLSRFLNSVATNAWLGLALAASCAFYAVFASPSQDN